MSSTQAFRASQKTFRPFRPVCCESAYASIFLLVCPTPVVCAGWGKIYFKEEIRWKKNKLSDLDGD
jgi:hypothetical protein